MSDAMPGEVASKLPSEAPSGMLSGSLPGSLSGLPPGLPSGVPYTKLLGDLEGVRGFLLAMLSPVPEKDALRVPAGWKNHLHWHLGHLLYVQSSALYIRAGEPSPIPKSFRPYFSFGTGPAQYDSLVPDWDELLARAKELSTGLVGKHAARGGQPLVKPLNLMNISATTVGEAIPFLLVHEGDHLCRVKQLLALRSPPT